MNPAALKANLGDLKQGGLILINTDAFDERNLAKAGYDDDPLDDDDLMRSAWTRLTAASMFTL